MIKLTIFVKIIEVFPGKLNYLVNIHIGNFMFREIKIKSINFACGIRLDLNKVT